MPFVVHLFFNMASLYIHIPFCKQKCIYCDFLSGTNHSLMAAYVDALIKEMDRYPDFFNDDPIHTIYFGGGTPSLLPANLLEKLFVAIRNHWNIDDVTEVTLECNPENITLSFLEQLKQMPINRLSIGVQSLIDDELKWLGRCHNAETAINAIRLAQRSGFDNISCDLIFALPVQTISSLFYSLKQLISLNIQHISVYSLMFEEGSKITKLMQKGDLLPLDENISAEMYAVVTNVLKNNGFVHYEISNYARPGFRSKHNSGYWNGVRYLGLGASAHSFNGNTRFYNIPHTIKYINAINNEQPVATVEILPDAEKFNDFVFTALRTSDGIDLNELSLRFGPEKYNYILSIAQKYIEAGNISITFSAGNPSRLKLTDAGVYISDYIISDFMLVE